MSCCKPFAERSSTVRGMTLIEVMISQVIALIVISAMMSVVVAMVNKLQAEVATSDAQVNLRQVSHLLLRDTQGVGSSAGSTAGDFVVIQDGGATAPDSFTLFRRDESVCGGSLPVANSVGNVLNIDNVGAACPFSFANCTEADVKDRTLMVLGANGQAIMMTGRTANASSCKVNYPTGQQENDVVAAYNRVYSPAAANINKVFDQLLPIQILAGSGFTYRIDRTGGRNMLQRSVNNSATFSDILDNVLDLQVQRVFQTGTVTSIVNEGAALPTGVVADDFIGLRIGIVTFARSIDGLTIDPPPTFGNRNLATAPKNRRYRASFIFTAARNRPGA